MTNPLKSDAPRRFRRLPFIALFVTVGIVAGLVFAFREQDEPEPVPNGLTLLLTLSSNMNGSVKDISRTNIVERERFVAANPDLVRLVRAAMTNEIRSRQIRNEHDLTPLMFEMMSLRRLGTALALIASSLAESGDTEAAADILCISFEMGCQSYRGGVGVQYLVGTATSMSALGSINELTPQLTATIASRIRDRLTTIDRQRESVASVVSRERKWIWFKSGWWKSAAGIKRLLGDDMFLLFHPNEREKSYLTLNSNVVLRLELRARGSNSLPEAIEVPMFW